VEISGREYREFGVGHQTMYVWSRIEEWRGDGIGREGTIFAPRKWFLIGVEDVD
jgi:hypothetical protein